MKRLVLLLLACAAPAFAQTADAAPITRLVVLNFDAQEAKLAPLRLGLATTIQRGLNVIDGVYVAPVGEAMVLAQHTPKAELTAPAFAAAFSAKALISGNVAQLTPQGDVKVELFIDGPDEPLRKVAVTGSSHNLPKLSQDLNATLIRELDLSATPQDRQELAAVAQETPALSQFAAVARASLGVGAQDTPGLAQAARAGSSWAQAARASILAATGETQEAQKLIAQAAASSPEDVETQVGKGIIAASAGDAAGAKAAFAAALKLNPDHAVALAGMARFTQAPAEAALLLERALAAYPRYAGAYLELARVQAARGKDVLPTLAQGVKAVPDAYSVSEAYIKALVQAGQHQEAAAYLQQSVREPWASSKFFALASELSSADYRAAQRIISKGQQKYAGDIYLSLAEAEVTRKHGNLTKAETLLQVAQGNYPNTPAIASKLALVQAEAGKLKLAAATLRSASATTPELANIFEQNLAQIYLDAGAYKEAATVLAPLLGKEAKDTRLYLLYALALGRSGDTSQALNTLDEVLRLEPQNQQAQKLKAFFNQQSALLSASRARLEPEARDALAKGLKALDADNLSDAAAYFDQAVKASPTGLTYFYQGYARQQSGALQAAADAYDKAAADLKGNGSAAATALNNAGYAYQKLGRLDKAVTYYKNAVKANPKNGEAQLNLGLVYLNIGNQSAAAPYLKAALAAKPELAEGTITLNGKTVPFKELTR